MENRGTRLSAQRNKIELVLTVLVLTSYMLEHTVGGVGTMLMGTLFLLAAFYFLSAFLIVSVTDLSGTMALKIAGIGSAVCVAGLAMDYMRGEGAHQMMIIGIFSVLTAAYL